jgi:hypothetical protein
LECPVGAALPQCCDSRTQPELRGVVLAGVPVGTPEYVAAETRRIAQGVAVHLPQRIATKLASHFHEAQLLLRKCSVASLMFLTRGVPPALAAPAQRLFDGENVGCMLSLLRAAGAVGRGSSAWQQIQLPLGGGMGGLGVTSLEAVGPAAHVASIQASLGLLQRISPHLLLGFDALLPCAQEDLPSLPVPAGAASSSLALYRRALAALPSTSYHLLCDGEESARVHGGRTSDGGVTAAAAAVTEQSDARSMQHRLTQSIMKQQREAFLGQLQAECSGVDGLWEMAQAQLRSFAGGGAAWMESYAAPARVRSWQARIFLRSVLRLLPEEVPADSWWTCPRTYCRKRRFRLEAIAHASCERSPRRHNAFVEDLSDLFRAFPGQPEIRREVQNVPAANCRMDLVVDGAWTASKGGQPGAAPDRRRLLVDASIAEPMSVVALESLHSWRQDGAAAAHAVKEKERRYGSLIADDSHCKLVPFVVETWGRVSETTMDLLKGTAALAAQRECERDSCDTDDAEARRDARVAAAILQGWVQQISGAVVAAQAEQLDRLFHPLAGTVCHAE